MFSPASPFCLFRNSGIKLLMKFSLTYNTAQKLLLILLLLFPILAIAQFESQYKKLEGYKNPKIEDYEQLVFDSTEYLLNNPIDKKSADFVSACKIVTFWMQQDTGYGIPLGGNFYYKLTNTDNQQYFYAVSIVNYLLDQKINHQRILKCLPIDGQLYRKQEDVIEVRLKAAELFLNFAKKRKNNIKLNARTKKYLHYQKKGNLKEKFLDDIDNMPTKKQVKNAFHTTYRPT